MLPPLRAPCCRCRYGFPFDRHDWFVDRNGQEVRYVIDYYYSPEPNANVAGPAVGDLVPSHTKSIHVDVRPAVDSVGAFVDRLRRFPGRAFEALRQPKFRAEGLDPATAPTEAAAFALHSSDAPPAANAPAGSAAASAAAAGCPVPHVAAGAAAPAASAASAGPHRVAAPSVDAALDELMAQVQTRCGGRLERLKAASPAERQDAHVAFNYCVGTVACPAEAGRFMSALEAAKPEGHPDAAAADKAQEEAFLAMTQCVHTRLQPRKPVGHHGAAAAPAGPASAELK